MACFCLALVLMPFLLEKYRLSSKVEIDYSLSCWCKCLIKTTKMHKHLSKEFLAKSDKSTRKYRSFSEIDDKLSNYNFGFGLRNRTWMTGKQQSNETK